MMIINNKEYTEAQIEEYCSNINQIGGITKYVLSEGKEKGTEILDVNLGELRFQVVPDRGLDIYSTSYKGKNLTFNGINGAVNPMYYSSRGYEWNNSFFGGLLTTCGLTYLGYPTRDEGVELGLHGRYSNTPAIKVISKEYWDNDSYEILITGKIQDTELLGNKLVLDREIRSKVGGRAIIITDKVKNVGSKRSPFTILYHTNFGFPFLSEDVEIFTSADKHSALIKGLSANDYKCISMPNSENSESAFLHGYEKSKNGHVLVVNRNCIEKPLGIYMSFDTSVLDKVNQWSCFNVKDYVLAFEPSNVTVADRKTLRETGELPYLNPKETIDIDYEIGVLEGSEEINGFIKINGLS